MVRRVLVASGPGLRAAHWLDIDSGCLAPSGMPDDSACQGTAIVVEGQTFALYAVDGVLWLQWDAARWPIADDGLELRYGHDLDAAVTTFSVNGRAITYPAWWRGDPAFEPLWPEEDEHHDWLAYVMAVKSSPSLQAALRGPA